MTAPNAVNLPPVPKAAETFPFPEPFITIPVYIEGPPGTIASQVNPQYFAIQEAAQWLADRYGAVAIQQQNGVSGPYSYSEPWWVLVFPLGVINAGIMCAKFLQYPSFSYVDDWARSVTNNLKGLPAGF